MTMISSTNVVQMLYQKGDRKNVQIMKLINGNSIGMNHLYLNIF